MKRHWNTADFHIVSQRLDPADIDPDGTGYGVQVGYCAICKADMQRHLERMVNGKPVWGPLNHYNSHRRYRQSALHLA